MKIRRSAARAFVILPAGPGPREPGTAEKNERARRNPPGLDGGNSCDARSTVATGVMLEILVARWP